MMTLPMFTVEWAQDYARHYWQHGGEPESQAALDVLSAATADLSAALADRDRYRLALHNILTQAHQFEDQALMLYGGDSPQRIWAWGLSSFIEEQIRDIPA